MGFLNALIFLESRIRQGAELHITLGMCSEDIQLGFTYLTPVSLIPHHLASLWISFVPLAV
jgi:hypothetical protein